MTQTVSFTRMADGTQQDYELLEGLERAYADGAPDYRELALGVCDRF